jgi:hypothetical protein
MSVAGVTIGASAMSRFLVSSLSALLVPVCGAVVFAGAVGWTSAPPARAAVATSELTLHNDGAAVKTSNGQSWVLTVADTSIASTMTVGIERTVSAGGAGSEGHLWYFASAASSLTFDKSTGTGTVKGGSATSPVATIDLTFTATSHKAADCSSGSETIYTGTLSGEAKVVTGLTGGGTVGGKALKFTVKGSAPEMLVDSSCVPVTDECVATLIFSSGVTAATPEAAGLAGTVAGKKYDFVTVAQRVTLAKPAGAYRVDDGLVDAPPATYNTKTGKLSVTSTSAGMVTGSATLSGGSPQTQSFPCSFGGKSYTVTATSDTTAKYSSPSGEAVTAHTSLTGNLVAPDAATGATYDVETVKSA